MKQRIQELAHSRGFYYNIDQLIKFMGCSPESIEGMGDEELFALIIQAADCIDMFEFMDQS